MGNFMICGKLCDDVELNNEQKVDIQLTKINSSLIEVKNNLEDRIMGNAVRIDKLENNYINDIKRLEDKIDNKFDILNNKMDILILKFQTK
jgi:hypothetical protein